ncbi:MAG: N-acetylmuramoyl-L-alanine amidase [Deltaproteobacteria bacterium]|nr:N-acetylmuramoyl-L-alanine amidase [Deltaproteobacteria bacterium]
MVLDTIFNLCFSRCCILTAEKRRRIFGWIGLFLMMPAMPVPAAALDAKERFHLAEACKRRLMENPRKQRFRHNWETCIKQFYAVYQYDPEGMWAAAGLFQAAQLYEGLSQRSGRVKDRREAVDLYRRIMNRFPESAYSKRAAAAIASLTGEKPGSHPAGSPEGPGSGRGDNAPGRSTRNGSRLATVSDIRHWSNPTYTRVVVDVADEVDYNFHLLKMDPDLKKPPRLYVDLSRCRLEKDIVTTIPINDDLLSEVRAGQYQPDSVRVVLDIKSFERYKIFSLKNPFRIVIDVWGEGASTAKQKGPGSSGSDPKIPKGSLARQLALGVSRIVIDPGHGGKDFGAPGYIKGVHEKNIVLDIAKRLAAKVRKKLKLEVILTRHTDRYLTLEERTAIANTRNADLFISIHTNASRDHRAYGLETYFLNLATDDEAILVAARENATSTKNISDLEKILFDLMHNAKVNESRRLAGLVQNALVGEMEKKYTRIRDKGVKQAPFYVLLGAQMPAILVETSFISNPRECRRLMDPVYQERLCDAIIDGIEQYIRETHPVARRDETAAERVGCS